MLGKFVVFWEMGNVHHFFDTYEDAEKYCKQGGSKGHIIAYVVAKEPPVSLKTVPESVLSFLQKGYVDEVES